MHVCLFFVNFTETKESLYMCLFCLCFMTTVHATAPHVKAGDRGSAFEVIWVSLKCEFCLKIDTAADADVITTSDSFK